MDLQNLLLKYVSYDKIAHFLGGGWIACFAPVWWWAVVVAFGVGLIKETIIDMLLRKSKFDLFDLIATTLGGAIAAVFMFLGLL